MIIAPFLTPGVKLFPWDVSQCTGSTRPTKHVGGDSIVGSRNQISFGYLPFSNRNVETILDRDVLPLLFSFVAKGKVTEKEKAFKSFLVISSKSSRGKGHIISHLRANYGKPGIQEAAKRLGLEQKRPQTTQGNLLFYTFLKVLDSELVWKNHIFILHPGD